MRRSVASALALLALIPIAGQTACSYSLRRAVVVDELLEPLGSEPTRVPSPADLAAARLARVALVSTGETPAVDAAFSEVAQAKQGDDDKRLVLLATDLRNTTQGDPIAYRDTSRSLRRSRGIDPRLAGRLDQVIAEDPLAQARRRIGDGWHSLFARTFNSVAEPLGQSAITGFILAPYTLTNSFIHYFAEFSNTEPLSQTGRQALVLRQEFVAAYPENEVAPKVERLVERDESLFAETLALRRVRAGEIALESDQSGLALYQSRAATNFLAAYPDEHARLRKRAARLEARSLEALDRQHALLARSLEATATPDGTLESELALASALLRQSVVPGALEPELADYGKAAGRDGDGRIDFVRALAQHEGGYEEPARRTLEQLAGEARSADPMTRHARQLLEDDWQNPYDAFRRLRRIGRRDALAYRLAGEWVNRPRYPNLPAPLAYLIDTPTIAITIVLAPIRALISPFTGFPDFQRATALAGYRYLLRYPEGTHQRELVEWLYDYERGEDRYGRALRLADLMPEFPTKDRQELVEKAAVEQIDQLERVDRRDQRASVLRGVAIEFPDSEGGRQAGQQAREEFEQSEPAAHPHHPRIPARESDRRRRHGSGPQPAAPERRRLGRRAPRGRRRPAWRAGARDPADRGRSRRGHAPESRIRRISKQRLIRLTAALDEAVRRNSLIDEGARFAADANREAYLEQARLGLTDDPDLRPTAESDFIYQSVRERYGAVRGRDSVLPFDLVFRGSLGDFSLGAFPRWRAPKETPDAFLYR